ncbi:MAG TPA: NosD domain-containing protein [Dehalococcoidia bacterium]|nr:NosD domain-containing protein [Dehalococcoidia bacterium]
MDSAIKIVGTLGATCWVVPSNAVAKVKQFAQLLQNSGYLVWVCDGVADQVEINAALAAGKSVALGEGNFNITASINLDSNQTLKGNGKNTILTTATAGLIFISAVGGSGTEKTGITISDMQIDGATVSEVGIWFKYVDFSVIQNVYARRHSSGAGTYCSGIYLWLSDFNQILGNNCQGPGYDGIFLKSSNNNIISGTTCVGNNAGIALDTSNNNTVSGNVCQGNIYIGMELCATSRHNTVSGNVCQGNNTHGINLMAAHNNVISGNTCVGNSQQTDNIFHNIRLEDADYNLLIGNLCRDGGGAKQPQYGICIFNDACDRNCLVGNDLYDSGRTGDLNDVPTTNPTLKKSNRNLAGTGWIAEV